MNSQLFGVRGLVTACSGETILTKSGDKSPHSKELSNLFTLLTLLGSDVEWLFEHSFH